MAKKKQQEKKEFVEAEIRNQPIVETLEFNYMPYAVSVVVSRAIPEIDGFKPSHRKLLYTMYKMGLMTGARTKSANIVGQTMRLNPHGDAAIYETMVRLSRGNEALLHPFVDSKGSFGKQYSRDMAYAAPRYTEAKLDGFCSEIFEGIDRDAVDMIDNYDSTMKEPALLPTTFPNILVSPNLGIAVGMTTNICSFNLAEICDATIAILKNPKVTVDRLMEIVEGPDFSGGALMIRDDEQKRKVFESGRGTFKQYARYRYNEADNCVEILEIPYLSTIEMIMEDVTKLYKDGKLKEISDFRDEIDLNGFRLTFDFKGKSTPEDADKLMGKLYATTRLQNNFNCNFNVLIDGNPRLLGVKDILINWIAFRMECLRRQFRFDRAKKSDKLHQLEGLGRIYLDIDRAIRIIRETKEEADVVPNLMEGFGIDEVQAEYVAEIKLRHLNRAYIHDRLQEEETLRKDVEEIDNFLRDDLKVKAYIIKQLIDVKKKFGMPRKTQLCDLADIPAYKAEKAENNFAVHYIFSRDGYLKKLTAPSYHGDAEQRLKEGDEIAYSLDGGNEDELAFFTNKGQIVKMKGSDFDVSKAGDLGEYVAAKKNFEEGERPLALLLNPDFTKDAHLIYIFENGKGVRVPVSAYQTKGNRFKFKGAFSAASPLAGVFYETEPIDLMLVTNEGRGLILNSSAIAEKQSRASIGVTLMDVGKRNGKVARVLFGDLGEFAKNAQRYRKNIPSRGAAINSVDAKQLKID